MFKRFVRFKNRTQAAMAIEMLDQHRVGTKKLAVKFSSKSASSARPGAPNMMMGGGFNAAAPFANEDDEEGWETVKTAEIPVQPSSSASEKRPSGQSIGRGRLLNAAAEKQQTRESVSSNASSSQGNTHGIFK